MHWQVHCQPATPRPHRTLYVFGCAHEGCGQKESAWRAFVHIAPERGSTALAPSHQQQSSIGPSASERSARSQAPAAAAPMTMDWEFGATSDAASDAQGFKFGDLSAALDEVTATSSTASKVFPLCCKTSNRFAFAVERAHTLNCCHCELTWLRDTKGADLFCALLNACCFCTGRHHKEGAILPEAAEVFKQGRCLHNARFGRVCAARVSPCAGSGPRSKVWAAPQQH